MNLMLKNLFTGLSGSRGTGVSAERAEMRCLPEPAQLNALSLPQK
jgi:hypothetical protein